MGMVVWPYLQMETLAIYPLMAPEFKWKILDSYKDALRRQLCEGLYILEAGALNKKVEFNRNIICRLESPVDTLVTNKQLKQEINRRRTYNEKIACFIKKNVCDE